MKKFLSLMLVLLMVFSLAACSPSDDTGDPDDMSSGADGSMSEDGGEEEETIKIAYLSALLTHSYYATLADGLKTRADELGNIEISVHDANNDATAMLNAMENYIADDYDAIIISPLDGNQLEEATKIAREKGITVISHAQGVPGASLNYILDEYAYGWSGGIQAGQWIVDNLGGEAEVAILTTSNIKELQQRSQGIEEGILSVAPNAVIVARQPGNLVEVGLKATESILQANPNVQVIASVNDAGALGAYEAVVAANKVTENFFIGGLDATQEALDKMAEEDSIFRATVDIDPYGNGLELIDYALEGIANNGTLPEEEIIIAMNPVTQEDVRNK